MPIYWSHVPVEDAHFPTRIFDSRCRSVCYSQERHVATLLESSLPSDRPKTCNVEGNELKLTLARIYSRRGDLRMSTLQKHPGLALLHALCSAFFG